MSAWALRIVKASLRVSVGLAFALALSACFASETELVGYWGADRPVAEGVYTHTPTHPDGLEWDRPTWSGSIGLSQRRYVSDAENFPHQNARFHALFDNVYIVQSPREDGVGYGLAFVYEDGALVIYHQPSCSDVSEAVLESANVVLDAEGYCPIHDLDQLITLMQALYRAQDGQLRIDGVYRRVSD
ncbi:hypothetical protein [Oceanicaulis alexandrii]|uniref:hypothetical protein n=1 Tax=Oceanicaulis alexandrii TaxID=153233 RepID=UPI002353509A|nr:hypothetical protein [Oceanicaulis alexandrii]